MPVEQRLTLQMFRNVIRMIKMADMATVMSLRTATFAALKRLGVRRNPVRAVPGVPKGSDQVDMGSIITWLEGLKPIGDGGDKYAVWQAVMFDATAFKRTEG